MTRRVLESRQAESAILCRIFSKSHTPHPAHSPKRQSGVGLLSQGLIPLLLEVFGTNSGIDEIPGECASHRSGLEVSFRVYSRFLESLHPETELQMLIPAVKSCPFVKSPFNNLGKTLVSSGQDPLQKGGLGVVKLDLRPTLLKVTPDIVADDESFPR